MLYCIYPSWLSYRPQGKKARGRRRGSILSQSILHKKRCRAQVERGQGPSQHSQSHHISVKWFLKIQKSWENFKRRLAAKLLIKREWLSSHAKLGQFAILAFTYFTCVSTGAEELYISAVVSCYCSLISVGTCPSPIGSTIHCGDPTGKKGNSSK